MSTSGSTPSLPPLRPENRAFLLRKLHSLTGVVPLGVFLVLHLWTNAHALVGRHAFETAVTQRNHMPFALVLEVAFVLVPLLFHAGFGVKLALQSRPNLHRYSFGKNWAHMLQRVTGLLALVFIVVHLFQYRVQRFNGRLVESDLYDQLCASLSSTQGGVPWMALFYLVGVAACTFHFSNGLYGFLFSWGATRSRRATRLSSFAVGSFGIVLFAMAAAVLIYFATGSRLLFAAPDSGLFSSSVTCLDTSVTTRSKSEEPAPRDSEPAVPTERDVPAEEKQVPPPGASSG